MNRTVSHTQHITIKPTGSGTEISVDNYELFDLIEDVLAEKFDIEGIVIMNDFKTIIVPVNYSFDLVVKAMQSIGAQEIYSICNTKN